MGLAATGRRNGHRGGTVSGRRAEGHEERQPPGADAERVREQVAREEGDREDEGRRELDHDAERELEMEEGNPT
jgi:hypothetical protein